jgi:hypothetical protein
MSYIGSTPTSQLFAPGTDTFSGTGSQTAFTLSRNVGTVNDILVVVNNVDQQPSAYSVSGSTLTLSAAPSAGTNNIYVRYLSNNLQSVIPQQGSVTPSSMVGGGIEFGMRNRIINGDMRIDQRNAGASVGTASGVSVYTVDRFAAIYSQTSKFTIQQNAASVTPPAGFTNYLGATSSSAYSVGSTDFFVIRQAIEGLNVADLAWGTANAATVTLSFWVRSSLTGTFGGVIMNSAANRSYPFTYTINSANTWEKETITIAGDTSGTWLTTNGVGMYVQLGLGVGTTYSGTAGAWTGTSNIFSATGATSVVGTNGATFYITGVQLEKGSAATPFDYRPYGTELALCQRYYTLVKPSTGTTFMSLGCIRNGLVTIVSYPLSLPVTMRTTPTTGGVTSWVATAPTSAGQVSGYLCKTSTFITMGGTLSNGGANTPQTIVLALGGSTAFASASLAAGDTIEIYSYEITASAEL